MKVKVNIREFIEDNADLNGHLQVSAAIHLDDFFYGIPEEDEIDVDLDELLAQDRKIAQVWGIDDVRAVRPDLDDSAAWDVLLSVNDDLNAQRGLIRDAIEHTANALYPHTLERHWQGLIDVRIADTDGYGQDEVLTRLRDMAELLAKDTPDVQAGVDPGSVRLLASDETTGK
jgi:hypothetical protein